MRLEEAETKVQDHNEKPKWDGDTLDHEKESGHQLGGGKRQWRLLSAERGAKPHPPCPRGLNNRDSEEGFVEQWHCQLAAVPHHVLQNPHDEWMSCQEKWTYNQHPQFRWKGEIAGKIFQQKHSCEKVPKARRQYLSNHRCSSRWSQHSHLREFLPQISLHPCEMLLCTRSLTCNCKAWKPHDWSSNRGLVK